MNRFLTVDDIAERLNVSRETAYRRMREMYCLKRNGLIRVSEDDFRRWVSSNTVLPVRRGERTRIVKRAKPEKLEHVAMRRD